jgi:hypothetical protein
MFFFFDFIILFCPQSGLRYTKPTTISRCYIGIPSLSSALFHFHPIQSPRPAFVLVSARIYDAITPGLNTGGDKDAAPFLILKLVFMVVTSR